MKKQIHEYIPFYKHNLMLATPVIIAQLGQVAVQQVDNIMVGYLGTVELAASSFAGSIFIIGMIIAMGFSFGLTPLVGHAFKENNQKHLSNTLFNSLYINILITLIISILLIISIFSFPFMGQSKEVIELAIPYFITLISSLIPIILFFTLKQFAEGIGSTKFAMYLTIGSNLVNIILNYILIYGKLGFPEMGLLGAGIATFISRVFIALGFIIIFLKSNRFKSYINIKKIPHINKVYIYKLFNLGFPISLQMLLEVLAFAIGAIMAGWIGVVELASHQIVLGLASISFMIVVGVGTATTIRISHQFGHNDFHSLKMAAKASLHIVLTFMTLTGIIFFVFRNYIPHLFTDDPKVIAISSKLLIMAALFQLFDGLQVVMLSILRGLGDVKKAMIYAFIAYIFINIPLGYFLAFTLKLGIEGIWIAFIIGLGCASLMFYHRYRYNLNKINKH